ncbi:amidohydrolase [Mesosutterella sp. AGMB02718]|uniref:Amidohydrolase n=1 Tax=Mesosutterella faecium TaxID=2925194 RepID=A0ABT7IQ01_9BURK|nr:amidohydrolase [Mesosutterella sp. AGMB02718]MDL2059376.1 amidohydrolase [Mesosutterella sp. AGMB02718]
MADEYDAYVPEMVETRRRLHAHPELGWTEFETTALVAQRLQALGFEIHLGTEVVNPEAVLGRDPKAAKAAEERARAHGVPEEILQRMGGYTGCVGILDTGRPGPTLAFRHDMDALPIQEITDPKSGHLPAVEGFASTVKGVMHACGHDSHTATGLGVAHWLSDHKAELCGRIKLIFQPAEEGTRGAGAMVAAGVVDDVDWFFGAHVGTVAKPGEIVIQPDGYMATTKFDVNYTGVPSHAGGNPEKGRSALIAAADAAVMLTAITRTSEGDTRVAVGRLDAGEGRNITPVHAHMECEVRGSTFAANDYMFSRAQEVVKGSAEMMGVKYEIIKTGQAGVIETTDAALAAMHKAAGEIPGIKVRDYHNAGGSEDCTLFMHRVAEHGGNPGFFLFGCNHHGHHRPDFDIQDTKNMKPAFLVFVNLARDICGRRA